MNSHAHSTALTASVVLVVLASVATLTSCTALFGPARNSAGRVTGTSVISSPTLQVGDCFTFVDGSNQAKATVTPCANAHTYVVIGGGILAQDAITKDGLQNAVSAACSTAFDTFKKTLPTGTKSDQQFVVSTDQKNGKDVTSYLCVATDTPASS